MKLVQKKCLHIVQAPDLFQFFGGFGCAAVGSKWTVVAFRASCRANIPSEKYHSMTEVRGFLRWQSQAKLSLYL
jgi:hypothetical protein